MELLVLLGLGICCYYAFVLIPGLDRAEWLADACTEPAADPPSVSVIIAARNEAENVATTITALLAADYPNLEIIAVNDRSEDATGTILRGLEREHDRLKVVELEQLPAGWLGKVHALQTGYKASCGEWLCFTDADVRQQSGTLSMACAIARKRQLDHLSLYPEFEAHGFFEKLFVNTTWFFFMLHGQPWAAKDPRSRRYCGVGAFNLIRREVYQAIGTHERLRFELLDDMKLAKLVKLQGFRQDVFNARGHLKLRWQRGGLRSYILGIEKNAFAGLDFKVSILLGATAFIGLGNILPFVCLVTLSGPAWWAAMVSIGLLLCIHLRLRRYSGLGARWLLVHPIGCLLMLIGLWRSGYKAITTHSVEWRGTRYSLDELRKHLV